MQQKNTTINEYIFMYDVISNVDNNYTINIKNICQNIDNKIVYENNTPDVLSNKQNIDSYIENEHILSIFINDINFIALNKEDKIYFNFSDVNNDIKNSIYYADSINEKINEHINNAIDYYFLEKVKNVQNINKIYVHLRFNQIMNYEKPIIEYIRTILQEKINILFNDE